VTCDAGTPPPQTRSSRSTYGRPRPGGRAPPCVRGTPARRRPPPHAPRGWSGEAARRRSRRARSRSSAPRTSHRNPEHGRRGWARARESLSDAAHRARARTRRAPPPPQARVAGIRRRSSRQGVRCPRRSSPPSRIQRSPHASCAHPPARGSSPPGPWPACRSTPSRPSGPRASRLGRKARPCNCVPGLPLGHWSFAVRPASSVTAGLPLAGRRSSCSWSPSRLRVARCYVSLRC
jgi:hypothetical protein